MSSFSRDPYLIVNGVSLSFKYRSILSEVYLNCFEGEVTGLLGRNGSGKSCLFQVIYGTLFAEKSVLIDGTVMYNAYQQPKLITYLPQFHFIPKRESIKRVLRNFLLDEQELVSYFSEFENKLHSSIASLSGGEKRLLEVFAIIKSKSRFSLLDEPFVNLSPLQIEKIICLIKSAKQYKGFLITDHRYNDIMNISNRIYFLKNGKTRLIENNDDLKTLGYL